MLRDRRNISAVTQITHPETEKKPGVYYAVTVDGIELPVIDVTHPSFALPWTDAEQRAQLDAFMREGQPFEKLPAPLGRFMLNTVLAATGSVLARGMRRAQGTFLGGMDTYLYKLGPEHLGKSYAKSIDYRIAASLPALAVRLRLQDMVQLMAAGALPTMQSALQRPVHWFNIAGGPAIDSLNTLLFWQRAAPELLAQRALRISVLDLDAAGPIFGMRALAAWMGSGAPLHGLSIEMRHVPYNFGRAYELQPLLAAASDAGELVVVSSEGGLFEYGTDAEIVSNLRELRAGAPRDLVVVGSVTRADAPRRRMARLSTAATIPRGLAAFEQLVQSAGFQVREVRERPFSDSVLLTAVHTSSMR